VKGGRLPSVFVSVVEKLNAVEVRNDTFYIGRLTKFLDELRDS
jgi:hypothetical protein